MKNKKRLLYIVRYRTDESFNLKNKFDGQIAAFKALGFDVSYIGFDSDAFYLIEDSGRKKLGRTHFNMPAYIHTSFYHDLYVQVLKLLKTTSWDFIYWRSAPCFPAAVRVSDAAVKAGIKQIYEIPTFIVDGKENPGSLLRKIYFKCSEGWKKKLEKSVDCFVMIGDDAGGSYCGKPAVNITNGIDLSNIEPRLPERDADAIHILALASMCYWHGYDRLIRSLSEYRGRQRVFIHMVGDNDGGALTEWKRLTHDLKLEDSVLFHGSMTGTELNKMFALCDIGVSSLGLYRKELDVTSELKIREYTARGLPFICTSRDPSLDDVNEPFWLRLPNDASTPSMDDIVAFALKMRQDLNVVDRMRACAEKYMTWESQYQKVFSRISAEDLHD